MTPYYEHAGITIFHGDCREVIEQWEGQHSVKAFDLLLTDPPYGIRADRDRNSQANGWVDYGNGGWDNERPSMETLTRCLAVCKQAVIWGGNYFDLPERMGWFVWDKGQRAFSLADGELAWTGEQRALRIFNYPRGKDLESRQHPTQKPVELMLWCLSQFKRTSTVFDPFMGSGTTLVAAKRLGKTAVGIEREEKYCEIAVQRLAQEALQFGETA